MLSRILDTRKGKATPWMDSQSFREEKQRSYMEYTASQYCSKLVESFSIDGITKDCLKKSNKDVLQSFNNKRITTTGENNDMLLSYRYYKKCYEEEAEKNHLLSQEKNNLIAQLEANAGAHSSEVRHEMERLVNTNKVMEEKVEEMRLERIASEQNLVDANKKLERKEAKVAATSDKEALLKKKEEEFASATIKLNEEKEMLTLALRAVEEEYKGKIGMIECEQKKKREDLERNLVDTNEKLSKEKKNNNELKENLSECLIRISQANAENDKKCLELNKNIDKLTKEIGMLNENLGIKDDMIEELTDTNKCLSIEVEELKRIMNIESFSVPQEERISLLKAEVEEKTQELIKTNDICTMLMNSCTEHEKTILLTKTALEEMQVMHSDEVDTLQYTITTLKCESTELKTKADKSSYYKRKILNLDSELISVKESLAGSGAKHKFEIDELKAECKNKVKLVEMKITSNAHFIEKKTSLLKKVQEELTMRKQQIEDKDNIIHSLKENERNIDKCMFQKDQWERKCEQLDFGYERLKRKYDDVNREFADLRRKTRKELEQVTGKNKEEDALMQVKVKQLKKERDEYKKTAERTDRKMRERVKDLKKEIVQSKERRNEKIGEFEKISRKQQTMIEELQKEKESWKNEFDTNSKKIGDLEKLADGLKVNLEKKSNDHKKLEDEFEEFKKANENEIKDLNEKKKKEVVKVDEKKDSSHVYDDDYSDASFEDDASGKSESTASKSASDDEDERSSAESMAESVASVASTASLDETVASLEESIASLEDSNKSGGMGFKFSPNIHLDFGL